MKYFKRSNQWRASNVVLDLNDMTATSHIWWYFLAKINGKLVFNKYRYSTSTSKHQRDVDRKLRELGIKVDLYIKTSKSLLDVDAGITALKNAYRAQNFELVDQIKETFNVSLSDEEVKQIYVDMEEELCDAYLERSLKRQLKIEEKGLLVYKIEQNLKEGA